MITRDSNLKFITRYFVNGAENNRNILTCFNV